MKKFFILLISFLLTASFFSCSLMKTTGQEISSFPQEEVSESDKQADPKAPSVVGMSDSDWDKFFAEAKIRQKQIEEARAIMAAKAESEKAVREANSEILKETVSEPGQNIPSENETALQPEELIVSTDVSVIKNAGEPEESEEYEEILIPPAPVFSSVTVVEMPEITEEPKNQEEPEVEYNVRLSGENIHTVTPVKDREDEPEKEMIAVQPVPEPVVYIYEERVQKEPEGEDSSVYLREVQEKYNEINTEKAQQKDKTETSRLIILAFVSIIAAILMCLLIKRVTYHRPEKKKMPSVNQSEEQGEEFVPATFSLGNDELPEEACEKMTSMTDESFNGEDFEKKNSESVEENSSLEEATDRKEFESDSGSAEQDMLDILEE